MLENLTFKKTVANKKSYNQPDNARPRQYSTTPNTASSAQNFVKFSQKANVLHHFGWRQPKQLTRRARVITDPKRRLPTKAERKARILVGATGVHNAQLATVKRPNRGSSRMRQVFTNTSATKLVQNSIAHTPAGTSRTFPKAGLAFRDFDNLVHQQVKRHLVKPSACKGLLTKTRAQKLVLEENKRRLLKFKAVTRSITGANDPLLGAALRRRHADRKIRDLRTFAQRRKLPRSKLVPFWRERKIRKQRARARAARPFTVPDGRNYTGPKAFGWTTDNKFTLRGWTVKARVDRQTAYGEVLLPAPHMAKTRKTLKRVSVRNKADLHSSKKNSSWRDLPLMARRTVSKRGQLSSKKSALRKNRSFATTVFFNKRSGGPSNIRTNAKAVQRRKSSRRRSRDITPIKRKRRAADEVGAASSSVNGCTAPSTWNIRPVQAGTALTPLKFTCHTTFVSSNDSEKKQWHNFQQDVKRRSYRSMTEWAEAITTIYPQLINTLSTAVFAEKTVPTVAARGQVVKAAYWSLRLYNQFKSFWQKHQPVLKQPAACRRLLRSELRRNSNERYFTLRSLRVGRYRFQPHKLLKPRSLKRGAFDWYHKFLPQYYTLLQENPAEYYELAMTPVKVQRAHQCPKAIGQWETRSLGPTLEKRHARLTSDAISWGSTRFENMLMTTRRHPIYAGAGPNTGIVSLPAGRMPATRQPFFARHFSTTATHRPRSGRRSGLTAALLRPSRQGLGKIMKTTRLITRGARFSLPVEQGLSPYKAAQVHRNLKNRNIMRARAKEVIDNTAPSFGALDIRLIRARSPRNAEYLQRAVHLNESPVEPALLTQYKTHVSGKSPVSAVESVKNPRGYYSSPLCAAMKKTAFAGRNTNAAYSFRNEIRDRRTAGARQFYRETHRPKLLFLNQRRVRLKRERRGGKQRLYLRKFRRFIATSMRLQCTFLEYARGYTVNNTTARSTKNSVLHFRSAAQRSIFKYQPTLISITPAIFKWVPRKIRRLPAAFVRGAQKFMKKDPTGHQRFLRGRAKWRARQRAFLITRRAGRRRTRVLPKATKVSKPMKKNTIKKIEKRPAAVKPRYKANNKTYPHKAGAGTSFKRHFSTAVPTLKERVVNSREVNTRNRPKGVSKLRSRKTLKARRSPKARVRSRNARIKAARARVSKRASRTNTLYNASEEKLDKLYAARKMNRKQSLSNYPKNRRVLRWSSFRSLELRGREIKDKALLAKYRKLLARPKCSVKYGRIFLEATKKLTEDMRQARIAKYKNLPSMWTRDKPAAAKPAPYVNWKNILRRRKYGKRLMKPVALKKRQVRLLVKTYKSSKKLVSRCRQATVKRLLRPKKIRRRMRKIRRRKLVRLKRRAARNRKNGRTAVKTVKPKKLLKPSAKKVKIKKTTNKRLTLKTRLRIRRAARLAARKNRTGKKFLVAKKQRRLLYRHVKLVRAQLRLLRRSRRRVAPGKSRTPRPNRQLKKSRTPQPQPQLKKSRKNRGGLQRRRVKAFPFKASELNNLKKSRKLLENYSRQEVKTSRRTDWDSRRPGLWRETTHFWMKKFRIVRQWLKFYNYGLKSKFWALEGTSRVMPDILFKLSRIRLRRLEWRESDQHFMRPELRHAFSFSPKEQRSAPWFEAIMMPRSLYSYQRQEYRRYQLPKDYKSKKWMQLYRKALCKRRSTRNYINHRSWYTLQRYNQWMFRSTFRLRNAKAAQKRVRRVVKTRPRKGSGFEKLMTGYGDRLDATLMLLNIAPTSFLAREMSPLGLLRVNGKIIRDKAYRFQPGDMISFNWAKINRLRVLLTSHLKKHNPDRVLRDTSLHFPANFRYIPQLQMAEYRHLPKWDDIADNHRINPLWFRLSQYNSLQGRQ